MYFFSSSQTRHRQPIASNSCLINVSSPFPSLWHWQRYLLSRVATAHTIYPIHRPTPLERYRYDTSNRCERREARSRVGGILGLLLGTRDRSKVFPRRVGVLRYIVLVFWCLIIIVCFLIHLIQLHHRDNANYFIDWILLVSISFTFVSSWTRLLFCCWKSQRETFGSIHMNKVAPCH